MTKWHLCVAFSKIYKDEVALASLREGGGPPQVVVGAREHRKETFSPKLVALSPACSLRLACKAELTSRREPMFHPLVLQQIACLCNLLRDSLGMGFVSNLKKDPKRVFFAEIGTSSTIAGIQQICFTRLGNSRNSPPSPWNGEGKLASQAENGFLYFLDLACVRARLKAFARTPQVCQPSHLGKGDHSLCEWWMRFLFPKKRLCRF